MTKIQLGKLQRRIWRAFLAKPGAKLSTVDLARLAFPRLGTSPLKHKHRFAIRRAAERVAVNTGRKYRGGFIWMAKAELPSAESDTYSQ